ncbi:MAG: response regulator, partial [Myxococcales bacterium]|nr:response regulator [Myxococcales bacterium]
TSAQPTRPPSLAIVWGPPSGPAAPAAARAGRRASILVVDDSEVTRDVIAEVLRDAGYEVTEAVDGRQALERIAAARPSLLVTDLQMPVMDGFALMRTVRENPDWKDMPMIVVSTLGSEADRTQAARAGADAYVVKSDLRRAILLEAVSRFVRPAPRGTP